MLVNPVRWVKDRMGHPLEAYWEIEVRDASGKLLTFRKFKAKSWLPQFLGLLKGQFMISFGSSANAGNAPVTDTSGAVRGVPNNYYLYSCGLQLYAGDGVGDYGLVVGSSDTPNTVNTYTMGAIIPHGNSANQLYYGATSIENPTNPSGTNYWIFRIIRIFTNNSGGSITVKEIGLIVKTSDSGGTARYFLIARDVISPVTVPAGATLTVRYIPKITVS
jgi:hypothetical protein